MDCDSILAYSLLEYFNESLILEFSTPTFI